MNARQERMARALGTMEQAVCDLARGYHSYVEEYRESARQITHEGGTTVMLENARLGPGDIRVMLAGRLRAHGIDVDVSPDGAGIGPSWVQTLTSKIVEAVP